MHPKTVKERAIVHYLHFLPSLRRVSRVYGVGKSTLGRWIRSSAKVDKPASRVPLHRKIAGIVGQITQHDPFCKGHQVVTQLRKQGIKASEATVSRARHVAGYSRKKVRACYLPKPPTPEAAAQYLATLHGAPEALAIDETCIYVEDAPRYGFSRKGERCMFRRKQPARTGKLTLLMAISETRGVIGTKVVKGSMNATSFAAFIDELEIPRGSVAILDNVSFHKTKIVRDTALKKGISLLFIPPYSPDFNPIEGTFSVLKASLRSGKPEDLNNAIASITIPKCIAFFTASKRFAGAVSAGCANLQRESDRARSI